MVTFVLIHGAGSDGWYWHLVEPELRAAGHHAIAVDLPCDEDGAGLAEYADAVLAAVEAGGQPSGDVVLVAQSMGGFVAPIVATRMPVSLIVLVAAMTPRVGESPGDWWTNTGHDDARRDAEAAGGIAADDWDPVALFLHDVPADVAAESVHRVREQSGTPFQEPWPLEAWPDVPTRFLLCRDDRLFPAPFQRRLARERLGIVPDEMDGGHLPALARPQELASRLLAYVAPETRGRTAS